MRPLKRPTAHNILYHARGSPCRASTKDTERTSKILCCRLLAWQLALAEAEGSCFALLRCSSLVASQVLLTAFQPWNASRHTS